MPSGLSSHVGMGAAILATLWAYDGWIQVSCVAGEMKEPGRILPRAILGGIGVVMLAYAIVNMALLHTLPAHQVTSLGENAASTAADFLFGPRGGQLISLGILVSMLGTHNSDIMTLTRMPFAMAERGQLPFSKFISYVHPRTGAPIWAIVFQIALGALLLTLKDPDRLTDIALFSLFVFNILAFVAVFILRKRQPELATGSYRVPFYPLVPLLAIGSGIFILVSTLWHSPKDSVVSLLVTLAGLPIYGYLARKKRKQGSLDGCALVGKTL
jgi:APA family basic amino acid/polyamine antiporter